MGVCVCVCVGVCGGGGGGVGVFFIFYSTSFLLKFIILFNKKHGL